MKRSLTLALPLLLLASGCSHTDAVSITGPTATKLFDNGVEQVIELQQDNPWKGERGAFALTSRLVNRGTAPVTMRITPCYLQYGVDVKSTPPIELLAEAIPSCIPQPDVITLQPGESSNFMWFGGIIQDPGTYKIAIRHSRDPEYWGTIEVTAR